MWKGGGGGNSRIGLVSVALSVRNPGIGLLWLMKLSVAKIWQQAAREIRSLISSGSDQSYSVLLSINLVTCFSFMYFIALTYILLFY